MAKLTLPLCLMSIDKKHMLETALRVLFMTSFLNLKEVKGPGTMISNRQTCLLLTFSCLNRNNILSSQRPQDRFRHWKKGIVYFYRLSITIRYLQTMSLILKLLEVLRYGMVLVMMSRSSFVNWSEKVL